MMDFNVRLNPKAKLDSKEAVDYYNLKQKGLGKRFYDEIKQQTKSLNKNPLPQYRYNNVRCLPLDKFPYMIHVGVDETNAPYFYYLQIETLIKHGYNNFKCYKMYRKKRLCLLLFKRQLYIK